MTRLQVVAVSRQNLNNGEPGTVNACPIALALRESGWERVEVMPTWVWAENTEGVWSADLPLLARAFVVHYDLIGRARAYPPKFYLRWSKVDDAE